MWFLFVWAWCGSGADAGPEKGEQAVAHKFAFAALAGDATALSALEARRNGPDSVWPFQLGRVLMLRALPEVPDEKEWKRARELFTKASKLSPGSHLALIADGARQRAAEHCAFC